MGTLGADPELILFDKDGVQTPSFRWLQGTKDDPVPMKALGNGYSYHCDNVSAELNIPPCSTPKEFASAVTMAHLTLNKLVYTSTMGGSAKPGAYATYTAADLSHPLAKRFGCDPDFCVYLNPFSPREIDVSLVADKSERYFGGHIHFGYDVTKCPREVFVKLVDFFIGLQWLNSDRQGSRRRLYGLAGLFRPKPYGIEYRTLSSFWMTSSRAEGLATDCFALMNMVEDKVGSKMLADLYAVIDWEQVKEAIDTENPQAAERLFISTMDQFPDIASAMNVRL